MKNVKSGKRKRINTTEYQDVPLIKENGSASSSSSECVENEMPGKQQQMTSMLHASNAFSSMPPPLPFYSKSNDNHNNSCMDPPPPVFDGLPSAASSFYGGGSGPLNQSLNETSISSSFYQSHPIASDTDYNNKNTNNKTHNPHPLGNLDTNQLIQKQLQRQQHQQQQQPYCLTPASSCTSLSDLTQVQNQHDQHKISKPTTTTSRRTLQHQSASTSSLANLSVLTAVSNTTLMPSCLNDSMSSSVSAAATVPVVYHHQPEQQQEPEQEKEQTQKQKSKAKSKSSKQNKQQNDSPKAPTTNAKKRIRTSTSTSAVVYHQNEEQHKKEVIVAPAPAPVPAPPANKPNIVRRRGRPPKAKPTPTPTPTPAPSHSVVESESNLGPAPAVECNVVVENKPKTRAAAAKTNNNNNKKASLIKRSMSTVSSSTTVLSSSTSSFTRYNTMDNPPPPPLDPTLAQATAKAAPKKLARKLQTKSQSNSNLQKSKLGAAVVVAQPKFETKKLTTSPLRDKTNTINNEEHTPKSEEQAKQDLLNNAQLFYKNYDAIKLQMLDAELSKPTSITNNTENTENDDACVPSQPPIKSPMPALSWANASDLWKQMRLKDLLYRHEPTYMRRHVGIEPQMRSILIDWLVEIAYAYRLHRETLHLAIEYMDRFMTLTAHAMRVDRLQLIGITALFLAAKVEEIYPPKLKDFAAHMESYSANNEDAIMQFELFMLKTLQWQISPVTANTWLMTYVQIGAINYHKLTGETKVENENEEGPHNTHVIMPINIYKNSDGTKNKQQKKKWSDKQQAFHMRAYMKSVTLLDLCMFEMDAMRFNYAQLAASALYHMLHEENSANAGHFVRQCTGFELSELDECIRWMYPYADVCQDVLTSERMCHVKQFGSVSPDDAHNIQLYYQNLDLLKEAQCRRTPCKTQQQQHQMNNNNLNNIKQQDNNKLASCDTPPDSQRKQQQHAQQQHAQHQESINNCTLTSNSTATTTISY